MSLNTFKGNFEQKYKLLKNLMLLIKLTNLLNKFLKNKNELKYESC